MNPDASTPPLWQDDPLVGAAAPEVNLPGAPLARVLAQIRFPPIVSIKKADFIGSFQEAIRPRYPVLKPEEIHGLVLGPGGLGRQESEVVWRFSAPSDGWRVSLAPEFVALETTCYQSRSDFLSRLGEVLDALGECIDPGHVERVGLRYVDQLRGADLEEISRLVRAEMLGTAATVLHGRTKYALTETLFDLAPAQLVARWGFLPPRATPDPGAIAPIDEPSWILDLDMSRQGMRPFDTGEVMSDARVFAERIYTVFRWIVTPGFLRRFGGVE